MPGLEDSGNRTVSPPMQPLAPTPAPLLGPDAVSAMVDGFHKGVIQADDIISRLGEHGRAKRQAETETALTQTEQTKAVRGLIPKQAKVAEEQLRQEQAAQQYGSGVQDFMQLAPQVAGFTGFPKTADGHLDYDIMGAEGNYLKAQYINKTLAAQNLVPGRTETLKGPQGEYRREYNKLGEEITAGSPKYNYYRSVLGRPLEFHSWNSAETMPAPGKTTTAEPSTEEIELSPAGAAEVNRRRAELVNQGLVTTGQAVKLRASDILKLKIGENDIGTIDVRGDAATAAKPTVEVAPAKPQLGQYIPGLGTMTGSGERHLVPSEGMSKIQLAAQAKATADQLKAAYEKLLATNPIFTGLVAGTLTKAAAGKRWNEAISAFEREVTAITAPIAKGTYNETGVLTEKDIERYKGVLPDLRDTPAIGKQKIERLIQEIDQAYARNLDLWTQGGYDMSGFKSLKTVVPNTSSPSTATAPTGKIVPIQGIGNVYLGADGQYHVAQ